MKKRFGNVWSFETKRFAVTLRLERDYDYKYDGDDADGETQAKLDSGEYVAFDSCVSVELDGETVTEQWLGGSVYGANEVADFYTAHRDRDAMNRNCSLMRAARGNVVICHYFPDMVSEAIGEARDILRQRRDAMPYLRA